MGRKRVRKSTKQPVSSDNDDKQKEVPADKQEESFIDEEVERQAAGIIALRNVEIEQLRTMIRLFRSYFSKEQLQVPVLQFFKENLPNLSIAGKDDQYEVRWKEKDGNISVTQADEETVHASLLHRLSLAYPDISAGIFSNKSVKTGLVGADKLQIRRLILDEPSDSQMSELKDGLQTPNVSNNRLSVGVTPKTLRLPKYGEMLLSVNGSPLGVYKEDNMETIQETEDC